MRHPSRSQHEQLLQHRHNPNAPALAAAGTGILQGQAGTASSSASLRSKIDVILPYIIIVAVVVEAGDAFSCAEYLSSHWEGRAGCWEGV